MSNEKKKNNECNRFSVIHWLYKNWNWVRIYSLFPQKTPPLHFPPGGLIKVWQVKTETLEDGIGRLAQTSARSGSALLCEVLRSERERHVHLPFLHLFKSVSYSHELCLEKHLSDFSIYISFLRCRQIQWHWRRAPLTFGRAPNEEREPSIINVSNSSRCVVVVGVGAQINVSSLYILYFYFSSFSSAPGGECSSACSSGWSELRDAPWMLHFHTVR